METYVAHTLNAKGGVGRLDYESETLVAHSLRGGGFDASEDGSGRGTSLAVVAGTLGSGGRTAGSATNQDAMNGLLLPVTTIPLLEIGKGSSSRGDGPNGAGFGCPDDPMFTLQASAQHGVAIAFDETQITSAENRNNPQPNDPCHPLVRGGRAPTLAYRTTGNDGVYETGDVSPCLNTATDPNQVTLLQQWRVRRLTPNECEALQGFPKNFTLIPGAAKGGWRDVDDTEDIEELKSMGLQVRQRGNVWHVKDPDGPRYRALGNSMAVNVIRWIGRRIEMVEKIK